MFNLDRLHLLASHILGTPIYIIRTGDGVEPKHTVPHAVAWTAAALDVTHKPLLESMGKWEGRRPAVVLHDAVFAEQVAEAEACGMDAEKFATEYADAVMVHELAHIACRGGVDLSEPTDKLCQFADAIATYSVRCHIADEAADDHREAVKSHDADFVRACVHAVHRARQIGFRFPGYYCFGEGATCDFDYDLAESALSTEPESLSYMSIFDINKTTRPTYNFRRYKEAIQCQQQ
ncbi:hypothetical protein Mal15_38130 [Stieleria maiorica]|uniref:Uncharacterized protein n=1 Tax=Stieleria maiorica TaxID=2795974 RepID=A0A5B9MLD8_9BACT|nr:hypothetical protein [Stieleria maiorica]QEF99747.1 hypothetical protein Mal15_38130 [Stieleria maiorica]